MSISRIVLDADTRSTVNAIQQMTRSNSPSAAIALMVSRYGRHLLETWELSAARYPEPQLEQYLPGASAVPSNVPTEFQFADAIEL